MVYEIAQQIISGTYVSAVFDVGQCLDTFPDIEWLEALAWNACFFQHLLLVGVRRAKTRTDDRLEETLTT